MRSSMIWRNRPLRVLQHSLRTLGRSEDGPVDAAALEDADVLQQGAVRREQLIGVSLHRVHTAQLLIAAQPGTAAPRQLRSAAAGGDARPAIRSRTGRPRAEHSGQGRRAAVDAAAQDEEYESGQRATPSRI